MDERIKQLIASAGVYAELLMIFYKAFIAAGFTDKQAVCFCSKMVQSMMDYAYEKNEKGNTK